jgi:hypothetical protein
MSATTEVEFTSPPRNIDAHVDAFHDGEEVQFHTMENIAGSQRHLGWQAVSLTTQSCCSQAQRSHTHICRGREGGKLEEGDAGGDEVN